MLDVKVYGEGDDVVLLHGSPVPPATLDPIRRRLETSYRVIVPDAAGIGVKSTEVRDALQEALLAHDVESASIVGHSMGAYRAFHLAVSSKIDVTRIVAIGPLAYYPEGMREEFVGLADALDAGDLDLAGGAEIFTSQAFTDKYLAEHPDMQERVTRWFEDIGHDDVVAALRGELDLVDLRPHLSEIDVSVYIRVGTQDESTPPEWSREIAELLPDARLDVVEGAAHFLQYEDPGGTIGAVEEFLNVST